MKPELNFEHRFIRGAAEQGGRTLILLHGTGGDEYDLIPMARELSPRSTLLSPRGKVLEGRSPRFFRRLKEGVFDLEDLAFRTDELADFLKHAAREYDFTLSEALALGFSNGANMAASLLLRHPHLLAGGILIRPMLPYPVEDRLDLGGVQVLILSGESDEMVPLDQAVALAETLETAGAHVQHVVSPAGHAMIPGDIEAARIWLSRNK